MTTATQQRQPAAAPPVHEIRLGRIKATIWANETDRGVRYNVTLRRLFLDAEQKWQSNGSFGRDDLLLVAKVADLAHTWIFENSQADGSGHEEEEESQR